MTYAKHVSASTTPQTEALPGREKEMVKNAAGGYVFQIGDWARLNRFLILGCEGGTYYETERDLTKQTYACVLRCLAADGVRVVNEATKVSVDNLAPKNDPAIFVLAVASVEGNEATRKAAYTAMPLVCRIGTHLFTFCEYREALGGGWGRGMKNAVSDWYTSKTPTALLNQALKYQQRNGWSHRDLLRLSHAMAANEVQTLIFDAIVAPKAGEPRYARGIRRAAMGKVAMEQPLLGEAKGWERVRIVSSIVDGYMKAHEATSAREVATLITEHGLQREFIPTEHASAPEVWEALLPHLGPTALLRNLGNLGRAGLLVPAGAAVAAVTARLANAEDMMRARVHPWAILLAARMYARGHGRRSTGAGWTPVPQVVDALDSAFEASFGNITPLGQTLMLAVDVSGSMGMQMENGLTVAEAAAAMMMVTMRVEPAYYAFGFATEFRDLKISARDSLQTILEKTRGMAFGRTDCAAPLHWMMKNKIKADGVMVYTDNETYAGPAHVSAVLEQYRRQFGVPLKLGMVGFTATASSLVDSEDPLSMNFVGADAGLPQAIAAFLSGAA